MAFDGSMLFKFCCSSGFCGCSGLIRCSGLNGCSGLKGCSVSARCSELIRLRNGYLDVPTISPVGSKYSLSLFKTLRVRLDQKTLKKTKAFSFRSDTIDIASPTQLNCGNLQGIKSDDVVRKIRSKALTADDYVKDDFHDILLMCNDRENNFVQHAGMPCTHCYSKEQMDILGT
ncbi:hypothetical protein QTP88_019188 [Uroleucon formosanum]